MAEFTHQIVAITDMTGMVNVSENKHRTTDFNAVSKETQQRVLRAMLGDRLYETFMTAVDAAGGAPTEEKWDAIYTGLSWERDDEENDDGNPEYVRWRGLRDMLKYFVFYDWVNVMRVQNTVVGSVSANDENSEILSRQQNNAVIEERYNDGVDKYRTVQKLLADFKEVSLDHTGVTEAPAGTYTIAVTETPLLDTNDTITIDGAEQTVTSSTDTTIVFADTAGQTFDASGEVVYQPFLNLMNENIDKIFFNGTF